MECIQLSLFGRMSPELSVLTAEKISAPCWKNLPAWNNQTLQFLDLRGGGGQRWKRAGTIIGDGWSLAWRQLDSQYFGVAQRRKRIALILDLGGQRAGEILFERTSLSRHPDPCIPTWKEATGLAANRSAGNDRVVGAGCFCKGDGNTDCGRTKAKRRKERVVTNAVKQLRTLLKSVRGVPEAARAHLCRQKKLGRYRHSKTKRFSS